MAVDRHRPRKLHLVAGVVLALAGVLFATGHAFGQDPPPTEAPPFEPVFEYSACPYNLSVPGDVTLSCGFVTVLEDRATLSGNTIELYPNPPPNLVGVGFVVLQDVFVVDSASHMLRLGRKEGFGRRF